MATVATLVMKRGATQFTSWGSRLPDTLRDTDQTIPPGLVTRLHRYALAAMDDAGFDVLGWRCEIYTMDGDLARSERMYCVEFTNNKGGMIGLQGILIGRGGHPCLDHGLSIDAGRAALTQEDDHGK